MSEIAYFTDPAIVTETIKKYRDERQEVSEFVCSLGGGILKFAGVVFPEAEHENIYALVENREPKGRGAHFDVYAPFIDQNYPLIAIYNLEDPVKVTTSELPRHLAESYFETFKEPTNEAFDARRHYSQIALKTPGTETRSITLISNMGLVLPQRTNGPDIIHDVVPVDDRRPGRFIKLVVPDLTNEQARKYIIDGEYKPIDILVTESLGGNDVAYQYEVADELTDRKPGRTPKEPTSWVMPEDPMDVINQPPAYTPPRRPCNLD